MNAGRQHPHNRTSEDDQNKHFPQKNNYYKHIPVTFVGKYSASFHMRHNLVRTLGMMGNVARIEVQSGFLRTAWNQGMKVAIPVVRRLAKMKPSLK